MKESKFLGTKELITVTIFTLLLLTVRFALEVLAGIHPLAFFCIAILAAILSAPFFVLLQSKVQKIGTLSIYSGFMMLFCVVKGWYESAIIYFAIGLLAELLRYGLRKNIKLAKKETTAKRMVLGSFLASTEFTDSS